MSNLITSLNFADSKIVLKIEPFKEVSREDFEHELLTVTLCELFSCYQNGYLCRGRECWALFKRGKAFYLFNPLGILVEEKKIIQRRAVLYRFTSLSLMAEQLLEINDEIEVCDCDEIYEFGAIQTCPSSFPCKQNKPKSKLCKKKPKKCPPVVCDISSEDETSSFEDCCV